MTTGRQLTYLDNFSKLTHILGIRRDSLIPSGFPKIGSEKNIEFYRSLGDYVFFINSLRIIRNELIE